MTTTLRTSVVPRFLKYVTIDTQSQEDSTTFPSTAKQLVLLDLLVEELKAIGLEDASRDSNGYVFATVPARTKKKNVPVIGFIAHVDTSPEMPGVGVKPIVHENYKGGDIVLPDEPSAVIRAAETPALKEQIGNDIITASGKTLLGADNKAGVAEIVAAAEYFMQHPEVPHGVVKLGFTPDEEVGHGADRFDVARFGAKFAYTMDAGMRGEIEAESFSADSMTLTFQGHNTHPGYAKNKMVNSIKVAADFISRLPKNGMAPETTEDHDGFVHPYVLEASVDRTAVKFLIRDFSTPALKEKERALEELAKKTVQDWPGATVSAEVKESYRNMKEVLDQYPHVVEYGREAIRRAGLEVRDRSIRGGTDGCRLSFMGLPTPNLFAGEQNFHSRLEWVSAQDMEKAVEVIVNLAQIWEEKS